MSFKEAIEGFASVGIAAMGSDDRDYIRQAFDYFYDDLREVTIPNSVKGLFDEFMHYVREYETLAGYTKDAFTGKRDPDKVKELNRVNRILLEKQKELLRNL